MKKCISYWSFEHGLAGTHSIAAALLEVKSVGFEGLELCISTEGELSVDTSQEACARIRKSVDESGLSVETLASGMSWQCNPVSDKAAVRERSLAHDIAALERAAWLGCQAYLYVPGIVGSPLSSDVVRYDVAVDRARENVNRLLETAERVGVDLCVENVWNGMFYSPLELIEFVDSFRSRRLGVYFDVGNVLGYHQDPADWIAMLGDRIRRVHVKDFRRSIGGMEGFCDLGAGDVAWPRVMKALHEIGYDRTLVAEMLPWDPTLLCRTNVALDQIMSEGQSARVPNSSQNPVGPNGSMGASMKRPTAVDPIRFLILGAGSRGAIYANLVAQLEGRGRVVGVAEPRAAWRTKLAAEHAIPSENIFSDWRQPLNGERMAGAVVIATPDRDHVAPTIAYAEQGYHLLLEKPLALSAADCRKVADAVRHNGVVFAVCHVLRYAHYTRILKQLLDAGRIGRVVSVQHLEPVGYWHQAHSFVRGNWRNEAESSCMLLAKACHDIDWLTYIVGEAPARVSSFGSLFHFHRQNAPPDATEFCVDCPAESSCPYSAKKIYQGLYQAGNRAWPLDILTPEVTSESINEAVRTGPYGRCVYQCDNDVVDHQVVNIEFQGGQTASVVMTAFTKPHQNRQTRIFGTKGEISCDGRRIELFDFLTETSEVHEVFPIIGGVGHDGAEEVMLANFVDAVSEQNPARVTAGVEESLQSYLTVFAAELSRREGRVISLDQLPVCSDLPTSQLSPENGHERTLRQRGARQQT